MKRQDICIPRKNVPKCDGVRAHSKDTPFFRNGFSEACDGRLGRGIVSLADVAVESGRARNVDNTAVLNGSTSSGLDAHERRGGANEAERRSNVNFQDELPCIVRHCVQHTVKGEAGFRKPCQ